MTVLSGTVAYQFVVVAKAHWLHRSSGVKGTWTMTLVSVNVHNIIIPHLSAINFSGVLSWAFFLFFSSFFLVAGNAHVQTRCIWSVQKQLHCNDTKTSIQNGPAKTDTNIQNNYANITSSNCSSAQTWFIFFIKKIQVLSCDIYATSLHVSYTTACCPPSLHWVIYIFIYIFPKNKIIYSATHWLLVFCHNILTAARTPRLH